MPAAGKSSVGPLLAEALGYSFFDVDRHIESTSGLSIAQLFATRGEAYFRQLEFDVMKCLDFHHTVVSVGGGAACQPVAAALMLEKGYCIYLEVPVSELARRLEGDYTRPQLAGAKNVEALNQLLHHRAAYYARAHLRYPWGGGGAESESRAIARLIEEEWQGRVR